MNKEIEKLLDKMKNIKNITCESEILTFYESGLLLDYITNLQQENKILKENAIHNDKVVDKVNWENRLLKDRIDKAIEYCELNKEFTPRLLDVKDILKGE